MTGDVQADVLADVREGAHGDHGWLAAAAVLDCPAGRRWFADDALERWASLDPKTGLWRADWSKAARVAGSLPVSSGERAVMRTAAALARSKPVDPWWLRSLDLATSSAVVAGVAILTGIATANN
ncbi:hypothetical protein [Salininema proteolyticum]|uniref:Uncharacterized protein n=1 Tax=Salininema proteolyticum TaxID=1607685 RepID=A0ABV8TU97_9ACTN